MLQTNNTYKSSTRKPFSLLRRTPQSSLPPRNGGSPTARSGTCLPLRALLSPRPLVLGLPSPAAEWDQRGRCREQGVSHRRRSESGRWEPGAERERIALLQHASLQTGHQSVAAFPGFRAWHRRRAPLPAARECSGGAARGVCGATIPLGGPLLTSN